MNSDRLVTKSLIDRVKREFHFLGVREAGQRLKCIEPELLATILESAAQTVELLEEYEMTSDVRANISESVQWAALVAVEAQHRGHYELWRSTSVGTLLERLDPSLKRRRP